MAKGLEALIEARIREARERGAFDGLPGAGRPLPPDELAGLSADDRFAALLARSCGGVPDEVALFRELAELREAFAAAPEGATRDALREQVRAKSLRLVAALEGAGRFLTARAVAAQTP